MTSLKRSRLLEILESFKNLTVAIIGDFALDAYWYCDMIRSQLSRETPYYTRPVVRETYSPGASGNICYNVGALGVEKVCAVTVLGEDWRGRVLKERMEEGGILLDGVIASPDTVTSTYVKPILCGWESEQEDSRLDFTNQKPLSKRLTERLIRNMFSIVHLADAVIAEDQMSENGVVTDEVRTALIRLARKCPDKVFWPTLGSG